MSSGPQFSLFSSLAGASARNYKNRSNKLLPMRLNLVIEAFAKILEA